ncbi:11346_t:CDS:2 [Dentiscutata erythropus]|uniref:11346_t:CDS:1 n=1 Tax=Dentiscutata erythropus TaxID=1348616 RepID=A0A9N9DK19_9GLOM|nr:11346_t:CDS:2 [Dentiscutata erythropus]
MKKKRERLSNETSSESKEEPSTTNTSNSQPSTNLQSLTDISNSLRKVQKSNRYYEATCYYCNTSWSRGKLAKLEAHLANEYNSCPNDIS